MPFFLRPQVQHPLHSEDDLFSFLTALDPSSHPCAHKQRQQQKKPEPTFTPRFDVLETPVSYELHGELAGLKQEDLTVEFEDVQTLVIKGKTARHEPHLSEKAKEIEAAPTPKAVTEKEHQPTVEDDYDVADTPLSTPSSRTSTPVNEKVEEKKESQAPKPKYWVSERQVGSFERKFSFSQRLDIDDVTAELKDGVLRVVVPKSLKGKKVTVSLQ